jgi:hypothetical protein
MKKLLRIETVLFIAFSLSIFINLLVYAKEEKKVFGKGELRKIEGMYFLKLKGSYYEMGTQYGSLLKSQLEQYVQESIGANRKSLMKQYPVSQYDNVARSAPEQADFLKGISKETGIPYSDLLLSSNLFMFRKDEACSAILIKVNGGNLVHAKNSDYFGKRLRNNFLSVIEFNPAGKLKHYYLNSRPTGVSLQGINEKGISITRNAGNLPIRQVRDLASFDVIREVVQSATTLKEADQIIAKYATNYSAILTVASSLENNGLIYDVAYDVKKKNLLGGNDYLYVTNHFLATGIANRDKCSRYQLFTNYLRTNRIETIGDLIDLLAQKGTSYGINNKNTISSVIFNYRTKDIYFAVAPSFAASGKWYKYNFENDTVSVFRENQ